MYQSIGQKIFIFRMAKELSISYNYKWFKLFEEIFLKLKEI